MTPTKTRIPEFLAQIPLFNGLAPPELGRLASATTEVTVSRGQILFRRGDPCLGFHVVIYGQLKLMFVSPLGDEKVVRLLGPGDSFGEALMFMEKDYIVSAQALTDSLLLHVAQAAVFAELDSQPGFARRMLAGLSERLHIVIRDIEAYSQSSGTQRVVAYLLQGNEAGDGNPFRLEASKTVIASRLNLTPEHFSRILSDLRSNELIEINGRDITVLNTERLRELVR